MPAPIISSTDVDWHNGYLFGTIQGGPAEDKPFAELQEISIQSDLDLKELMGQAQNTAIAVGIAGARVTGSARWAKIRCGQFKMLRGGASVFSSPKTTHTILVTDDPLPFNLHLMSPLAGGDFEAILMNCVSPSLSIPAPAKDFVIPSFSFNAYGVEGSTLMKWIENGDHSTS